MLRFPLLSSLFGSGGREGGGGGDAQAGCNRASRHVTPYVPSVAYCYLQVGDRRLVMKVVGAGYESALFQRKGFVCIPCDARECFPLLSRSSCDARLHFRSTVVSALQRKES